MRNELIRRGWFHEGQLSDGKLQKDAYRDENNALRALKRRGLIGFGRGHVWLVKPAFQSPV